MKKTSMNTTIYNCHTHTFTIDHVPNHFGRKIMPVLYQVFTMRLVKWYYLHLTPRNKRFSRFIHKLNKVKYFLLNLLKYSIVGYWLFSILLFLFKWLFKILTNILTIDSLFSKQTKQTYKRYKTLGRYATYSKQGQKKVYDLLEKTYDHNTKFVVLPMDMDYMEAGKPIASYMQQLEELLKVAKNNKNLLPFIFADPRRIQQTRGAKGMSCYFSYLKRNLSRQNFHGIKLYPALGYYPFDKDLIETYKFAQENEIPITTHCIEGTVYYRGKKKEQWRQHPILKYKKHKDQEPIAIPLPQKKNYDFTTNFTHPLNYHCLLDKTLLSEYLGVETDLSKLKICLAHFGGTKEWNRYTEDNWNNYNNNITQQFTKEEYLNKKIKNTLNHGSKRTIFWNASWLSIIYDLMIQYENVYTDISFIIFNQELFPLLKYILQDEKVSDKILFGTDYYVVAQKNTEKALFQNLRSYIGETLFYKIAHTNPKKFLKTKFGD